MGTITFLGTGTSHGVPMIGCKCDVCLSSDPRDKRTRTSLLIEYRESRILIDAGIDLRQQALREGMDRLDAIVFTHTHADHVFGLDEVRRFNDLSTPTLPVYASRDSIEDIRRVFSYVFDSPKVHGGIPSIELIPVDTEPFEAGELRMQPVPILHGARRILGFRFGRVAYLTDCSGIPEESMALLEGLDLLILDALRDRPHPTHFSLEQACEAARKTGARRTLFVHMSHQLGHASTNARLPESMQLAYDGQKEEFS